MQTNLPVETLLHYLPHRPPMVWIDRVVEVGEDYKALSGTCVIQVRQGDLYLNEDLTIQSSAAIEFVAQSFGYVKAAFQVIHKLSNPPNETYLTGVRMCDADFSSFDFAEKSELEVRVSVLREILPLTFVRGEIIDLTSKARLATVEIQVYVD